MNRFPSVLLAWDHFVFATQAATGGILPQIMPEAAIDHRHSDHDYQFELLLRSSRDWAPSVQC